MPLRMSRKMQKRLMKVDGQLAHIKDNRCPKALSVHRMFVQLECLPDGTEYAFFE